MAENQVNEGNNWEVRVIDRKIHKDTLLSQNYCKYTFEVKGNQNHPMSNKNTFIFSRRFKDFEWLRERLCVAHKDRFIPPLPDKTYLNNTSEEFLEKRGKELARFLKRILDSEIFLNNEDVFKFIDISDDKEFAEYKNPTSKPLLSSFFSSISSTFSGIQSKYTSNVVEDDEWFDQQTGYIHSLETHFDSLLKKYKCILSKEYEISKCWKEISNTSRKLTPQEVIHDKVLSTLFDKFSSLTSNLSRIEDSIADISKDEFSNTINDYLKTILSIKDTLGHRSFTLKEHQKALKNKAAKEEKYHRTKDLNFKQDVEMAEKEEIEAKKKVEQISSNIREELMKFYNKKQEDFTHSFCSLIKNRIDYHEKCLELWKDLFNDALNCKNLLKNERN